MTGHRDKKVELLAPAGNFEKLEIAVHYGADAVYLAGKDYSLRNFSGNFSFSELKLAVRYAHDRGVRVYLACNIFAKNSDQALIAEYLRAVSGIGIDAVIVADPGVFAAAREILEETPIHLSTQANTTNLRSVAFWGSLGVRRVNLAREVSLADIAEIAQNGSTEIEVFIHGAMCVAYSGRCLLSSFLTGRESNQGMCTHPCRWNYALMEETRPGAYLPIAEDKRGTYILNSKDLCMIEYIPEVIQAGVCSLKIEGRMKGINYVATTVKVYREAIDAYYEDPEHFRVRKDWIDALSTVNRRGYCTGFYFGHPTGNDPEVESAVLPSDHRFVAKAIENSGSKLTLIHVRNKIHAGDVVDVFSPSHPTRTDEIKKILDESGNSVPFAQPGSRVTVEMNAACLPNDLIRKVDPAG